MFLIDKPFEIGDFIVVGKKGAVVKKYHIIGVPCHVIVGKDGIIIDRFTELPRDINKYLDNIFKKESRDEREETLR